MTQAPSGPLGAARDKAVLPIDRATHLARRYWRQRLDSMSFDGHLPLDHPRPRDGGRQYATARQRLGGAEGERLRRVTNANAGLAFTAWLVAVRMACARYSGRRDVTIVCPASPRALGHLVPIAAAVDPRASFKAALLEMRQLMAEAGQYQHYPYARLVLDLPDGRRPEQLSMAASLTESASDVLSAQPDLAVIVEPGDGGGISVHFDRRLYDEATAAAFAALVVGILGRGLADLSAELGGLVDAEVGRPASTGSSASGGSSGSAGSAGSFASAGDGARRGQPRPGDQALHELIQKQVAERPRAPAVVEGERVTTYEALDEMANEVAAVVADLPLDRGQPIGILMDASVATVAAIYGAWKAGASVAPLRPLGAGQPVASLLAAAGCQCVVCRASDVAQLDSSSAGTSGLAHAIVVDLSAPPGRRFTPLPVRGSASPDGEPGVSEAAVGGRGRQPGEDGTVVACILPATCGAEQGTAISHGELAALCHYLNERGGVGPEDRCLLSPSLGACELLYDTVGVLAAGASVEIWSGADLGNGRGLHEKLVAAGITVWDVPVALMHNILPALTGADTTPVRPGPGDPRSILLSGEEQSAELVATLRRRYPAAAITGLSATPDFPLSMMAFEFGFEAGRPAQPGAVIARPVPGFDVSVRNGLGEPVPVQGTGNLQVTTRPSAPGRNSGGDDIAPSTGTRVRRQGDDRLGWLRGEEHCFARLGCLVELTAVESALCRCVEVRAAEVLAVSSGATASEVVAFVIPTTAGITPDAVRDALVGGPAVDLIPDRFVLIDEFPLLANGAVDRDALQAMLRSGGDAKSPSSTAVDDLAAALRPVWLGALQVEEVSDEESFFVSGGNSLKATLLIARIRETFGVQLSVQNFFRDPTIRSVASLIAVSPVESDTSTREPDFVPVARDRYRLQVPVGPGGTNARPNAGPSGGITPP